MDTDTELMQTWGTAFGTAVGWGAGGSGVGGVAGSIFGGILGGLGYYKTQSKYFHDIKKQQKLQRQILQDKLKSDTESLYSDVKSSVTQVSGSMGAIYQ